MHRIIIAVVVGSLAIGGCKDEEAERKRAEQAAQRAADAQRAEAKAQAEAELKAEQAKIDALVQRLSTAKDETERAAIQKELDVEREAQRRKYSQGK